MEDYLHELANISEVAVANAEIDTPVTTNFTHAALLLQNSSNIYSRKVEYLHSLVYNTLSDLAQSIALHKGNKKRKEKNLTEYEKYIDLIETFDPNVNFHLLDDILPTVDKENISKITMNYEDPHKSVFNENVFFHVSHNESTLYPLDDTCVTANENYEDKMASNRSYLSSHAKSLASKTLMHTLVQDMEEGGNRSLMLLDGKCGIGNEGMLLVPGSSIWGDVKCEVIECDSFDEECKLKESTHLDELTQGHTDYDGNNELQSNLDHADTNSPSNDDVHFENNESNDDYDEPPFTCDQSDMLSKSKEDLKDFQPGVSTVLHHTSTFDPWTLLDPLVEETKTSKSTELRVGKTFRLPDGIIAPPSDCVTGARTKSSYLRKMKHPAHILGDGKKNKSRARMPSTVATFESILSKKYKDIDLLSSLFMKGGYNSHEDENPAMNPNKNNSVDTNISVHDNEQIDPKDFYKEHMIPLKGLIFGNEFDYIARANTKRKAADRKSKKKLLRSCSMDLRHKLKEELAKEEEEEEHYLMAYDDIDDNLSFNNDLDNVPLKESESKCEGNFSTSCFDSLFHEGNDQNSKGECNYIEIFHFFLNIFLTLLNYSARIDNSSIPTFEELCRAHIKAFASGSERFAKNTNLSNRINDWQAKLMPILEDEEKRTSFDVNEYRKILINAIKMDMDIKKQKLKRKGQKNINMVRCYRFLLERKYFLLFNICISKI